MDTEKHLWQKVLYAINQIALPRTRKLERKLSAVTDENQALAMALERVRKESESARNLDRNQKAEFGQKIAGLESERDTAHQQLQALKTLLETASIRQESTSSQVVRLENEINEERAKHESTLETMKATLTQVQREQQVLLQIQSGLDDSIHKTRLHLLEAIQTASVKPHNHVLAMIPIAAFFLLGGLAGATSFWNLRQDLLELSAVSRGLKQSIDAHISRHEVALTEKPVQKYAPVLPELDDSARVAQGDHISYLDKSNLDFPDPRPGETEPASAPHSPTVAQDYGGKLEFNPSVKELQANLLALGFDLGQEGADGYAGAQTEQALQEFQFLYLPVSGPQHKTGPNDLVPLVRHFADLAREDERQFRIDSGVLAAIRLSSLRTGVEFSFLMELAAIESTFDSDSRAVKSSAAGLYQFKHDTWLETVKRHGDKYGIGNYVSQVEYFVDSDENRRPMIRNPVVYQHVLDLRHNPRMAALMAAEYLEDNMMRLSLPQNHKLGRTEMYLTHFLGVSGATTFLKLLDKHPDKVASDVFPGQAARNENIFHTKSRIPRTVAEVYDVVERKFNTSRYKDWRAN